MSKKLLVLMATVVSLTGCGSLVGPDDSNAEANAAKAKRILDGASEPGVTLSTRIAGN